MVVTVNVAVVFIVAILSSEDGGAEGACKMVHMVLAIKRRNVRSTKSTAALVAKKSQSAKIVSLTQRVLSTSFLVIGWKELRGNDLATILCSSVVLVIEVLAE